MNARHALPLVLLATVACTSGEGPAPPGDDPAPVTPAAAPATGLDVGQRAPDFEATAVDGSTFRLSESLDDGPVVVVMFRGSW